jgi:hypothetical protein
MAGAVGIAKTSIQLFTGYRVEGTSRDISGTPRLVSSFSLHTLGKKRSRLVLIVRESLLDDRIRTIDILLRKSNQSSDDRDRSDGDPDSLATHATSWILGRKAE